MADQSMISDHTIIPSSDPEDELIYSSDSSDPEPEPEPQTTPTPNSLPNPNSNPNPNPGPVTIAIPIQAVTVAHQNPPERIKPHLFQRLFTDEDEIHLLRGFLAYTASRGGASAAGHYHHDTAAFYDQIKDKLQLDFNKNQLVEKLRRLKKKYRTTLTRMASGKDFVFKSNHDQVTFEISKQIWGDLLGSYPPRGGGGGGGVGGYEGEFDDQNPNLNAVTVVSAAVTPSRPVNSSYVINPINLNSSGGGSGGGAGFDGMLGSWSGNGGSGGGGLPKLCTRKRSRVANNPSAGKTEEKFVNSESFDNVENVGGDSGNDGLNTYVTNVGVSSSLQGLVEETVRNCLSPVVKDLINNVVNGGGVGSLSGLGLGLGIGVGSPGFKGVETLALNAIPLNFSAVNVGGEKNGEGGSDEKWRKQQIMELEVYSKRLDLVQDQIKLTLDELRSMES